MSNKNNFKDFTPYALSHDEEYMNDKQLAHFKAILEGWRYSLINESERTVQHMQDEAYSLPDPNDRASQEEEFSLELRARDRERKLLAKIDKSLRDLSLGDYGYCAECGVDIGIRRLEARPTAELCIDCKEVQEQKEKTGSF